MFDQLFGNPDRHQQFARAQTNHDAVDPHDAAEYVGQFMQHAPQDTQQQVLRQYMSQLDPQQRQSLAQAMIQHNGTPVQDVRYDDDDDMIHAFQRSGQALTSNQQGGGLASSLGGLFGMMGGPSAQQGGFDQGMGGASGQQQGFGQPQQGGLGGLLQNPMARAGLASLAGVIASQMMNRR